MISLPGIPELFQAASQEAKLALARSLTGRELWEPRSPERLFYLENPDPAYQQEQSFFLALLAELVGQYDRALHYWDKLPTPLLHPRRRLLRVLTGDPAAVLADLLEGEPPPWPHLLWIAAARCCVEGWNREVAEGILILFDLYPQETLFPPALWLFPSFLKSPFHPEALSRLLKPLRAALPEDLFFLEIEIALRAATGEKEELLKLLTSGEFRSLPSPLKVRNFHLALDLMLYELKRSSEALTFVERVVSSLPDDPSVLRRAFRLALNQEQPQLLFNLLPRLKEADPDELKKWLGIVGYELVVRHRSWDTWTTLIGQSLHPYTLLGIRLSGKKEEWITTLLNSAKERNDPEQVCFAQRLSVRYLIGEKGDRSQSWVRLQKALEENPDHPDLLRLKVEVCEATRRYEELEKTLSKLVPLTTDPKSLLEYRFRRAELMEMVLNKDAEAIPLYEELLRDYPGFLPAYAALERIYRRTRQFRKLAELLKRRAELLDEKEARIHIWEEIYFIASDLINDPDLALSALEQVIPLAPHREELIYEHLRLTLAQEIPPRRTLKLLKGLLYSGTLPEEVLHKLVPLWAELTLSSYPHPEPLPDRFRHLVPPHLKREWGLRLGEQELKKLVQREGPDILAEEGAALPEVPAPSDPWLRILPQQPEMFSHVVTRHLNDFPPQHSCQILTTVQDHTLPGITWNLAMTLRDPPRGLELWQSLPTPWKEHWSFWLPRGSWILSSTHTHLTQLFARKPEEDPLAPLLFYLKSGKGSLLEEELKKLTDISLAPLFDLLLPPAHLREGRVDRAIELLLSSEPSPPKAYAIFAVFGELLLKENRTSELLSLLVKMLSEVQEPLLARLLLLLAAQLRYELGYREEALRELKKHAPELDGDENALALWTSWVKERYPLRDQSEFLIYLGSLEFPLPVRVKLYREAGELALDAKDIKLATLAYISALKLAPQEWEIRLKLLPLYEQTKDFESLRTVLKEGLDYPAPQEIRQGWYLRLAELLNGTGEDLLLLERAITEQSEWSEPYRLLIARYSPETQGERIASLWEKLINLSQDPDELARGYAYLGRKAKVENELPKAQELLMNSLRKNPLQYPALEELREISEKLGTQAKFREFLHEYKHLVPRKETTFLVRLHRLEAELCVSFGERSKALEILKEAHVYDPQDAGLLTDLVELGVREKLPRSEILPWARALLRQKFHPLSLEQLLQQAVDQRRYDYAFILASLLKTAAALTGMGENLYRQGLSPLKAPEVPFQMEEWQKILSELTNLPLPLLKVYYLVGEALTNARASYVESRPQEERIRIGGEIQKQWEAWCSWRGLEMRDWYRAPGILLPETRKATGKAVFLPPWENQEILLIGALAALELDQLAYPLVKELKPEELSEYNQALVELTESKGFFSGKSRSPRAKQIEENLPSKSRKELEESLGQISGVPELKKEVYPRIALAVMALLTPDPGELLKAVAGGKPSESEGREQPYLSMLYPILLQEKLAEFRLRLKIQR